MARILKDVQKSADKRGIYIDRVGVSDLRYPLTVLDRTNKAQNTVGTFSLSVDLPHHFKGTHMSRFLEVLNEHHGEMSLWTLPEMLLRLQKRLEAQRAHIEVEFTYFVRKAAPVTGAEALIDLQCTFIAEAFGADQDFLVKVRVPVTSLCPCSKEISEYGAHNQRGFLTFTVRTKRNRKGMWQFVWIEELLEIAERSASAPIYALLKRPDERHVTMQAYDNPVFVEDMVRNAAAHLKVDKRIAWFEVRADNQESIHNHTAFAVISSSPKVTKKNH